MIKYLPAAKLLLVGTLLLPAMHATTAAQTAPGAQTQRRSALDQQIVALKAQNAEVVTALSKTIEKLEKTAALTPESRRAEFTDVRTQLIELGTQLQSDAPLSLAVRKAEEWITGQMTRLQAGKTASEPDPNIDKYLASYKADLDNIAAGRNKLVALQSDLERTLVRLAIAERQVTELLLLNDSKQAVAQLKDFIQQVESLVNKTNEFIRDVSGQGQASVSGSTTKG